MSTRTFARARTPALNPRPEPGDETAGDFGHGYFFPTELVDGANRHCAGPLRSPHRVPANCRLVDRIASLLKSFLHELDAQESIGWHPLLLRPQGSHASRSPCCAVCGRARPCCSRCSDRAVVALLSTTRRTRVSFTGASGAFRNSIGPIVAWSRCAVLPGRPPAFLFPVMLASRAGAVPAFTGGEERRGEGPPFGRRFVGP